MPQGAVVVPTHKMHQIFFFRNILSCIKLCTNDGSREYLGHISILVRFYHQARRYDLNVAYWTSSWAEEDFLSNETPHTNFVVINTQKCIPDIPSKHKLCNLYFIMWTIQFWSQLPPYLCECELSINPSATHTINLPNQCFSLSFKKWQPHRNLQ